MDLTLPGRQGGTLDIDVSVIIELISSSVPAKSRPFHGKEDQM